MNHTNDQVMYPASTYVWCKGSSSSRGRHPIFVSSPVRFARDENGRYTLLICHDQACAFCGCPARYEESDLGFQDGYVPRPGKIALVRKEPLAS